MTDTAATTRQTASALANWRDYIIYIGFVVIFLVFAATLGEQGLPRSQQPAQHHPPDRDHRGRVGDDDLRAFSTGEIDLSVGAVAGLASVATAMAIDQFGIVRRHRLRARDRRHRRRHQWLADHRQSASRPS